jgi:hypothetical protein
MNFKMRHKFIKYKNYVRSTSKFLERLKNLKINYVDQ